MSNRDYLHARQSSRQTHRWHDFARINQAAMLRLDQILRQWLPDGHIEGREYVALNPNRLDRHPGSFKINTETGCWADFATGDRGGDPISLGAYLSGSTQSEAAGQLMAMLGLDADGK